MAIEKVYYIEYVEAVESDKWKVDEIEDWLRLRVVKL
jgi:hypothetical protein